MERGGPRKRCFRKDVMVSLACPQVGEHTDCLEYSFFKTKTKQMRVTWREERWSVHKTVSISQLKKLKQVVFKEQSMYITACIIFTWKSPLKIWLLGPPLQIAPHFFKKKYISSVHGLPLLGGRASGHNSYFRVPAHRTELQTSHIVLHGLQVRLGSWRQWLLVGRRAVTGGAGVLGLAKRDRVRSDGLQKREEERVRWKTSHL